MCVIVIMWNPILRSECDHNAFSLLVDSSLHDLSTEGRCHHSDEEDDQEVQQRALLPQGDEATAGEREGGQRRQGLVDHTEYVV